MATLCIASLLSFFLEEKKSIKKGENHFKSDHIEAFTYQQGVLHGEVHASMKKKVYKVTVSCIFFTRSLEGRHCSILPKKTFLFSELNVINHAILQIYLDEEHEIKSTECECPRGAFKCSHAAALFIHGIHNLSRTDVECQWRKRKSNTSLSTQAVTEMFPPPKKYSALSRKPTQADRSALYEDLKEYGRFTGLCWLISPEPRLANQLPFPTIEEIIFSEEFLQAIGRQQQLDCLVRRSRLQQADIISISEVTVGQRDNPAWFLARRGRLTASNFGSVLKAKRITPSLLKRLLGEYDLSRVKAVQWGVNNEEEAIKAFTLKTGLAVKETGIWFHSSGILGASPDGIIDEETVLEVKCPYTERNITIEEAVASTTFCLEKCESGQGYALKKDHVY